MTGQTQSNGKAPEDTEIALVSIYKGFWKCRDLEIKMLWTRLTMLGTFMALTYTGYGVFLMKIGDKMPDWNVFHLLAVGMGCFGMLFSALWIMMAKGSKAWFEQYEAALKYFQKAHRDIFEQKEGEEVVLSYLNFDNHKVAAEREPVDSSLFTVKAGRFSVSKIPIVMGQISLGGWGLVVAGHFWCLVAGEKYMRAVVGHLGVQIAVVAVLGTLFTISTMCRKARSGFL
ncbi:MAG: hypothetical protein IKQ55_00660 [Kiritimatiellae bacterium]|nr:hypothetical protein [Kiritimatiellia bacterium]